MILSYQINARTDLAIRYNDISPLENHHCAVTFQILDKVCMYLSIWWEGMIEDLVLPVSMQPETNIFAYVSASDFKKIRKVCCCHMHTA